MRKDNSESYERAIAAGMMAIGVILIGIIGSWLFFLIYNHGVEWNPLTVIVVTAAVVALSLAFYSWFKAGKTVIGRKENIPDPSDISLRHRTLYDDRINSPFQAAWNKMKREHRLDLIIIVTAVSFLVLYFYLIEPLYQSHTGH